MRRSFLLTLCCLLLLCAAARADSICAGFPDGTICQPLDKCLAPGTCQGGGCLSNPAPGAPIYAVAGTVCLPSPDPCYAARVCDGNGMCLPPQQLPSGTVCDPVPKACSGVKTCNAAGQCLPTSTAPAGTICSFSLNPCLDNSVCDVSGDCVPGMPLPALTACAPVTVCSGAGSCNGAGSCLSAPQNEGQACAGGDVCQVYACRAGSCASDGLRDCSGGNPCLKKDSCTPGVGCTPTPICDMIPQDLSGLPPPDLQGADLTGTPPPDLSRPADLALMDLSHDLTVPQPDQARGLDLGPDAHVPVLVTGGACQYGAGPQQAPLALPIAAALLLCLCSLRRSRAGAQPPHHVVQHLHPPAQPGHRDPLVVPVK